MKKKGLLNRYLNETDETQKGLARKLGVDSTNVYYWLTCGYVSKRMIAKVAKVTGLDKDRLIREHSEAKNANK